jgi:hypothetical protein
MGGRAGVCITCHIYQPFVRSHLMPEGPLQPRSYWSLPIGLNVDPPAHAIVLSVDENYVEDYATMRQIHGRFR